MEGFTGKWCIESKADKKHKPGTFKKYYMELLPGGLTFNGCGADMKGYWRIMGSELILENSNECFAKEDHDFLNKHGFTPQMKGNWPNCGIKQCKKDEGHSHNQQQRIFEIVDKSPIKMTIRLVRETWAGDITKKIDAAEKLTYVLL